VYDSRVVVDMASGEAGQHIGLHRIWTGTEDIVSIELTGDLEGDEIREILAEVVRFSREHPRTYIVADVSRAGTVTASAREQCAGTMVDGLGGVFIVGASFHMRVLASFVQRAFSFLIRGRGTGAPYVFCSTRAEAEEALAAARRRNAH